MKKNLILLLTVFSLALHGQEKQIPLIENNHTLTIDDKLAGKANLFTEYNDFIEAKLFQISDSSYALEAFYYDNNEIYKNRQILSNEEKAQLISKLENSICELVPEKAFDQSGRTLLISGTTAHSLGYYGWALPRMLDVPSGRAFLGTYMLTAGSSFFLPYYLTKQTPVSKGQAMMTFYGQSRGIYHGVALSMALDIDAPERMVHLPSMLISAGEGMAGYHFAGKWNYTTGDASVFQMCGDLGILSGFGLSGLFGWFSEDNKEQAIFGTTLLTSGLGYYGGKLLADSRSYSYGDGLVFRGGTISGLYLGIASMVLIEPESDQLAFSVLLGSSAIGTYASYKLLQNKDFNVGQGVLIELSQIAGGLLGAGVGYLLSNDDNVDKMVVTTSSLSALAGYGLMYKAMSNRLGTSDSSDLNINFSINPLSLLYARGFALNKTNQAMEMANLRVTF